MNRNITNEFIYNLYEEQDLKEYNLNSDELELLSLKKILDYCFNEKIKEKMIILEKYKFLN
tara:strand:+ start:5148 stop:5330 length:183 start_codon:yes stop_codon:yes gene_type:complete